MASVARCASNFEPQRHDARQYEPLQPYICDTTILMRQWLDTRARVVIEGTQGFGLSLYDGGYWPKATSRCTTAASALAECGLSPVDVDDVTLVIRSFPIRVAGDSGPLEAETTWDHIRTSAGADIELTEYTSVTNRIRRVGNFDFPLVRRAIDANAPTKLVLNHLDHVDWKCRDLAITHKCTDFVNTIERGLARRIDWLGINEYSLIKREVIDSCAKAA